MKALPLLLLAPLLTTSQPAPPRFSFAVLADVQYGDQAPAGKREYRGSLGKLREAVEALNARNDLAFVIQLGDLIDSRAADLDPILAVYNRLVAPRRHVLGNHDFAMPRDTLVRRLGMPGASYEFAFGGWRFVVLDGMDLSVAAGSRADGTPQRDRGREMFERLSAGRAANANDWNGGVGRQQLDWLRDCLKRATRSRERVIVFCHFPVLSESSTPAHLLWNHEAVREMLEAEPSVAAWFNGHDHQGGYAERNGIHYVTFPGIVESGEQTTYSVVNVYADRLKLGGAASAPKRTLRIAPR
ncbi:MAG: metallophosphoesterase [Candidatus Solibacter sp.]|nr:metallophosphoesterase [Candidatus Solibacter sp.]